MIAKFKTMVSKLFNAQPIEDVSPALIHSLFGLTTEVGEIIDFVKKYTFYGKPFTALQIKEELGDLLFYIEGAAQAVGSSLDELMDLMIAKHGVRYPDGDFNTKHALKRDKQAELEAMREVERKYNGT